MNTPYYYSALGGLPSQTDIMTDRAHFTDAYMVMPKGVMRDIVSSFLPHFENTRLWVLARPMTGFSETFSHYIVEISKNGGSQHPEDNPQAESVIFVVEGCLELTIEGKKHTMSEGGYAFVPPAAQWEIHNPNKQPAKFHWIRKAYQAVDGIEMPQAFVTSDQETAINCMPDCDEAWGTTRFVEPTDLRHDMHVNIVTFKPGGNIPFAETHVMEHGLYVLEGKAVYHLNKDWVEVEAGDYMWLRAFCPQACVASGPSNFRYLLYKDVNRHAPLKL
jgi:(S)-ureidoglycine aminohydrolase